MDDMDVRKLCIHNTFSGNFDLLLYKDPPDTTTSTTEPKYKTISLKDNRTEEGFH